MPLHLLGKKSWNVYNAANIERVRRDEAAAADRETAEEQRMQEADAARRLAILRGEEPPPPLPDDEPEPVPSEQQHGAAAGTKTTTERRKRKRAGEDDTDFEMRVAAEQAAAGREVAVRLRGDDKPPAGDPARAESLVDAKGNVSLFRPPDERAAGKSEGAGREEARKKREEENLRAMRFSDAAGRGGLGLTDGGPWYAKSQRDAGSGAVEFEAPTKDVWGNEDPRRKGREAARVNANDPLAMMKKGAAKVRELGKERERDAEERERELRQLRREERRREKRRRKEGRDRDDVDDLEGFSLDSPGPERTERRRRSTHRREEGRRPERDSRLDEKEHRRPRRSEDDRRSDRHRRHRRSQP